MALTLLILRHGEVAALRKLLEGTPLDQAELLILERVVAKQLASGLNVQAARTLTIRDEGDGLPPLMSVTFDRQVDAEMAWDHRVEWP